MLRSGTLVLRAAAAAVACGGTAILLLAKLRPDVIDRSGVRLLYCRRSRRFFKDGWGHEPAAWASTTEALDTTQAAAVQWDSTEEHTAHYLRRRGVFRSPGSSILPEASRNVPVSVTLPSGAKQGQVPMTVWFPATGEMMGERERLAARLARRGIGSIVMEAPLYGKRRPDHQNGHLLSVVWDVLVQSRCVVLEAMAIIKYLVEVEQVKHIACAGISKGASYAALTVSLLSKHAPELPTMASTLFVAPVDTAAAVFVDGAISYAVNWSSLGPSEAEARRALREFLDRETSLAVLPVPPPETQRASIAIGAKMDAYLLPDTVQRASAYWPLSTLRWIDRAGHITGIVLYKKLLIDSVEEALGKLRLQDE